MIVRIHKTVLGFLVKIESDDGVQIMPLERYERIYKVKVNLQ